MGDDQMVNRVDVPEGFWCPETEVERLRAEVERLTKERDAAQGTADDVYRRLMGEIERLRAALEKIACRHVNENPLWWQIDARTALGTLEQKG